MQIVELGFVEQASAEAEIAILDPVNLQIKNRGAFVGPFCQFIEGGLYIGHVLILHDLQSAAQAQLSWR